MTFLANFGIKKEEFGRNRPEKRILLAVAGREELVMLLQANLKDLYSFCVLSSIHLHFVMRVSALGLWGCPEDLPI
jgi:hypothetical protein